MEIVNMMYTIMITTILGSEQKETMDKVIEQDIKKVRNTAIDLVVDVTTKLMGDVDTLNNPQEGITDDYKNKIITYETKLTNVLRFWPNNFQLDNKETIKTSLNSIKELRNKDSDELATIQAELAKIKPELAKIKAELETKRLTEINAGPDMKSLVTEVEKLVNALPADNLSVQTNPLQQAKDELKKSTEQGVEHIQTLSCKLVQELFSIKKYADSKEDMINQLKTKLTTNEERSDIPSLVEDIMLKVKQAITIIETETITKQDVQNIETLATEYKKAVDKSLTNDSSEVEIEAFIKSAILGIGSVAVKLAENSTKNYTKKISNENDDTKFENVRKKTKELLEWEKILKEIDNLDSLRETYYQIIKGRGDLENKLLKKATKKNNGIENIDEISIDACNDILKDEVIDEPTSSEFINIMRAVFKNKITKLGICEDELIRQIENKKKDNPDDKPHEEENKKKETPDGKQHEEENKKKETPDDKQHEEVLYKVQTTLRREKQIDIVTNIQARNKGGSSEITNTDPIESVPTAADSTKSETKTKGEGMSRTTQVLIGVGITAGVIIIAFFIIRGRHHLT
eukprot:GHVP01063021.1.p1 GENE.GHVP01063021.1~~GHVP01063021.1.p1  ORF type:complete len:575 (+),score=126.76 GHVP01063021.1:359-2083(+)